MPSKAVCDNGILRFCGGLVRCRRSWLSLCFGDCLYANRCEWLGRVSTDVRPSSCWIDDLGLPATIREAIFELFLAYDAFCLGK